MAPQSSNHTTFPIPCIGSMPHRDAIRSTSNIPRPPVRSALGATTRGGSELWSVTSIRTPGPRSATVTRTKSPPPYFTALVTTSLTRRSTSSARSLEMRAAVTLRTKRRTAAGVSMADGNKLVDSIPPGSPLEAFPT